jgi:hypothetical protein
MRAAMICLNLAVDCLFVEQVGNPMPLVSRVGQVGNLRPIDNRPR